MMRSSSIGPMMRQGDRMERPMFAEWRSDVEWTRDGRTLAARIDDVAFTAEASWLTGRWTVIGTSELALPVSITVYISRGGAAFGYWRNAPTGLRGMRDYFGYSDTPALAPILVGDKTLA